MKKISPLAAAAAATLLAAGCTLQGVMEQTVDEAARAPRNVTIHFTTGEIATKTTFGDAVTDDAGNVTYPTYWTENDKEVKISLNYEYAVSAGVNTETTDNQGNILRAAFDASFTDIDTQTPFKFYVVSPASALLWPSAERKAVSVFINAEQTPTAASIDEQAQVIVAQSASHQTLPSNVEVHFNHLTAYGKLTLKNVTVPDGASVTSVKLISDQQPLSGAWYYNFENQSMESKEASASLILHTDNIDLANDPVWFACAPVDMGGKPLRIYVNLDNGTALYREITLKSGVQFTSGGIYKFSVNMASAETVDDVISTSVDETVYQLVTSTSALAAGDEVIFVNSTSPTYAMTGNAASTVTNGLQAVAKDATSGFTLGSDGYIRLPASSAVAVLNIGTISNSSITFKNSSGQYLYMPSGSGAGSSRYLQFNSSSTAWAISISNGATTLSYNGGKTPYYLRYSSSYFNVTNNRSTFAIYKKTTATTTGTVDMSNATILQYNEYGAYLSSQNLIYNSSTDQLSREYESDGTLTFAILAPAESAVVEFAGIPADAKLGDTFTLQVTYIHDITTELEASYTVAVVKEDGPTLWLSDGTNGFIVKR